MKKLFLLIISLLLTFTSVSCGPSEEELTRNAYDEVLEERLSQTIELDSAVFLLEKYEFVSSYDHPDVYVQGSFNMYYQYDTNIFDKEEVKGYSGTRLRFTLKEEAMSINSYETYIDCTATNLDGSYSKTVRKKVVIPSWEYCIGYIYKGSATNFKMFDNNGTNGFYLQTQYISSGHFYEDTYVELDIPNELVKYKVVEYEKDTGGSYNFSTNEAIYYYGKQKVSINGSYLDNISELNNSDKFSFESSVSGMIKRFDRMFGAIGLDGYVSSLTK